MITVRVCLLSALLIILQVNLNVQAKPLEVQEQLTCGYESCNKAKSDALNVHLVPHSHDDVGWLKTVDQYYYGTKTNIQRADVNAIISSVVKALKENPERRFIQVETAFFHKWWHEQTDETKRDVHHLVENGQLEFTGGAWSMNDEGAVHYQSVVDQFTFGLQFLNDTFGQCGRPKIGWQIDPFGHSSEMASIFAQMGFDGLFFARLDWRDKSERLNTGRAEMMWQASRSLGNASNLFTSVLYNHYSAPRGFCFDVLCQEDPIVIDTRSTEYNFKEKVESFKSFVVDQAKHYKTNNILITMGDDFNYQDALSYFRNMDTLIEGFKIWPQKNRDQAINLFYSTPACYVKSVNDAVNTKNIELPLEVYDFFPYASDYHAYWSGYFSSRAASKRSERKANNLLQIHKQVAAFDENETNASELFKMQDAVGIMQHHDAITGTEKQHVADDYARILDEAFGDSVEKVNKHISKLLSKNKDKPIDLKLKQCLLKNMTICPGTHSDSFTVVVYNPAGRTVKYPVRIPVDDLDFEITGPNDESITYQISPSINDALSNYHGRMRKLKGASKYELTFMTEIAPLGVKVFNLKKSIGVNYVQKEDTTRRKYKLGSKKLGFGLNPTSGLIDTVTINGIELKMRQELLYYLSAQGDNSAFENRASGAYIFRSRYNPVQINQDPINITSYKGELYDEVHQVFSSWAKQVIRVYKDSDHIEFDWLVGPIPVDDKQGKEVISRFTSDMITWEDFYTDSNGREMIHRVRDFRPTYNYTREEPISGNYCPVTSQITITDGNVRMSLLNDRAQGGTSLESGQLELMVHRRMLYDDAFGVGEALNEMEHGDGLRVRGRHFLTFTKKDQQQVERHLAEKLALSPWIFISNTTKVEDLQASINFEFAGLTSDLPDDIRLLTLEPIPERKNVLILRLENFFDSDIGKTSSVDLKKLFSKFEIVSMEETTLAANAPKDASRRLNWLQYPEPSVPTKHVHKDTFEVTLDPMQIKTFIVHVKYNV